MQGRKSTGFSESSEGSRARREGARFSRLQGRSGGRGCEGEPRRVTGDSARSSSGPSIPRGEQIERQIHPDPPLQRRELKAIDGFTSSRDTVGVGWDGTGHRVGSPKQKRLLREALEFLGSAAGGGVTAERALKSLGYE